MTAHLAACLALDGRPALLPLLLIGWGAAWFAAQEPRIVWSPRHRDVYEFQKTELGHALTFRRGWVPETPRVWVRPLLVVLLVAPGLVWRVLRGLPEGPEPERLRLLAVAALVSPLAVFVAAIVVESVLIQPLILPFLLLFAVGFGVLGLVQGAAFGPLIFAALLGAAATLYAVDLLRLLRRAREE